MNKDEKIALQYLELLNFGIPKYEPDGNCPPDFSFEQEIGIEVRKLNQNYFKGAKIEGLEQASIRIKEVLKDCSDKFKSDGKTYLVNMEYKRPVPKLIKNLKNEFYSTLNSFLITKKLFPEKYTVNKNISLSFFVAPRAQKNMFCFPLYNDFDTGGWSI